MLKKLHGVVTLQKPSRLFIPNAIEPNQIRINTKAFSIQGNSSAGNLVGTVYTKRAPVKISGQGTDGAQFIVSSLDVSGIGNVTINLTDHALGRSTVVALVE